MRVETVSLSAFTVIGKHGQGPSRFAQVWIRPLWRDLYEGMEEIAHLIRGGSGGNVEGHWGLMSGPRQFLSPWDGEGRYLAGVEALPGVSPPKGWALWNVPAQSYLTFSCDAASYQTSYDFVMGELLRHPHFELAGATHEYYPASARPGEVELYVPIRPRE